MSNFTICSNLYDCLKNGQRNDDQFAWEWLLTPEEYDRIKKTVQENSVKIFSEINSFNNVAGEDVIKTARLLVLYIGEFYKREYDGNNGPFDNIENYDAKLYAKLCSLLSINPYKNINRANLFSLYVRGGLPVHLITTRVDNNRTSPFIESLKYLLGSEDDIDKARGEELLAAINNISLKESYHNGNGHSIYEYIQRIYRNEPTWHDSDNELNDFRNFLVAIQEAKTKASEYKKFKVVYSLWTYIDDQNIQELCIYPLLRFSPEEEGERHYAISAQKLSNWGFNTERIPSFQLKAGDTEPLSFSWCCNGDYISDGLIEKIELPPLDKSSICPKAFLPYDLEIKVLTSNNEMKLPNESVYFPYKGKDYLQFYTNDDPQVALWTTHKCSQSFLWSGILYDNSRYELETKTDNYYPINECFGWVFFEESITLKDCKTRKNHTFFNSKGSFYAIPKETCFHNILIVNKCISGSINNRSIEVSNNGKKQNAYIVKSKNIKFDLFKVSNDDKINVNPDVKYKNIQESTQTTLSWIDYKENEELKQGYYVFRLAFARYFTEVLCMVLPEEADIVFQSNSKPYTVSFNQITNVYSLDNLTNTNNRVGFKVEEGNNKEELQFKIGDDNVYAILKTYNPKPQTKMYLNGTEIKTAFLAFAEDTYFKSTGLLTTSFYLSEKSNIYKTLFNALTATARGEKNLQQMVLNYPIGRLVDGNKETKDEARKITQCYKVYSEIINGKSPNLDKATFYLLDLSDNSTFLIPTNKIETEPQAIANREQHDALLFQSLKGIAKTDVYFSPKYISRTNSTSPAINVKIEDRKNRLSKYYNDGVFKKEYAFLQFEIACKHKLYFAVLDSLLSMLWNPRESKFMAQDSKMDKERRNLNNNIFEFLGGYCTYCESHNIAPSEAGLKRLAREFLFDWNAIKSLVDNNDDEQLSILFSEIIKN